MSDVGPKRPSHHAVPTLLVVSVEDPTNGIRDRGMDVPSGDGERERLSSRFDGIFAPFLAHIFGEDNRGRKLVLVLAFRILHGIKLYEILGEVETMQRLLNYDLMT